MPATLSSCAVVAIPRTVVPYRVDRTFRHGKRLSVPARSVVHRLDQGSAVGVQTRIEVRLHGPERRGRRQSVTSPARAAAERRFGAMRVALGETAQHRLPLGVERIVGRCCVYPPARRSGRELTAAKRVQRRLKLRHARRVAERLGRGLGDRRYVCCRQGRRPCQFHEGAPCRFRNVRSVGSRRRPKPRPGIPRRLHRARCAGQGRAVTEAERAAAGAEVQFPHADRRVSPAASVTSASVPPKAPTRNPRRLHRAPRAGSRELSHEVLHHVRPCRCSGCSWQVPGLLRRARRRRQLATRSREVLLTLPVRVVLHCLATRAPNDAHRYLALGHPLPDPRPHVPAAIPTHDEELIDVPLHILTRVLALDTPAPPYEQPVDCQWRSKKGPPRRCKKGPLGGCGLVPVVHGRAPRATRRALNRLTRRRAREGPVGPRGQAWAGWSVQLAVGV